MTNLYELYKQYLERHFGRVVTRAMIFDEPYRLLRLHNSRGELREKGVFFTGHRMARRLVDSFGAVSLNNVIYDPMAGAGDLILAYLEKLPGCGSLQGRLNQWERIVRASEIEPSFVPVIKLRMYLLACFLSNQSIRLAKGLLAAAESCFPMVQCADFRRCTVDADLVLLNPPYNFVQAPPGCKWASGKVSNAAVLLAEIVERYSDARIGGILPDVIRSGSRYAKFRTYYNRFSFGNACSIGRFDEKTDVDVFFAVDRSKGKCERSVRVHSALSTIGDYFSVHVGAVVPFRDKEKGRECWYLDAKKISAGCVLRRFECKIKSEHAPITGPFIVVKRTSSPSDKKRCAAVLVESHDAFHLENHLIVITPKRRSALSDLRKLLQFLNSRKCSTVLNKKIRCRHLTVSVIKSLQIQENKNAFK